MLSELNKRDLDEIYEDIKDFCFNCTFFIVHNYKMYCFKAGVKREIRTLRPCKDFEVSYSAFEESAAVYLLEMQKMQRS